jgi:hypothetical protein
MTLFFFKSKSVFTEAFPAYLVSPVPSRPKIPSSFLFHYFLSSSFPLQKHARTPFDAEKIGFSLLELSTYKLRNNPVLFVLKPSLFSLSCSLISVNFFHLSAVNINFMFSTCSCFGAQEVIDTFLEALGSKQRQADPAQQ